MILEAHNDDVATLRVSKDEVDEVATILLMLDGFGISMMFQP